mgnify:CR=1 FL=1
MENNRKFYSRKHIRLKSYDYSNSGFFFITINIQKRLCLFGNIVDGIMVLNDAGRMIEKWYYELENKFPEKRCHEMVVMPDHFHCIIESTTVQHGQPSETIQNVIHWFKTMTTNEYIRGVKQYGWQRFDGKLWQRNFFDHIIRSEQSYIEKSEYIQNNPQNWRKSIKK